MTTASQWADLPDDPDLLLAEVGAQLVAAVGPMIPEWVVGAVTRVHSAWSADTPDDVVEAARLAGVACEREVVEGLRHLAESDVDDQSTTPLEILRGAVRFPTTVLVEAGVPHVRRDATAISRTPLDHYDLEPASLGDVSPDLHELGLVWGAAKAKAHLARRRGVPRRVVALVPDLMDASKLRQIDPRTEFVRTADALIAARADLAIVDLTRVASAEELSAIAQSADRTVGFGPHIDREVIDDARSRGVEAVPRSRFFSDVAAVVRGGDDAG